MQAVTLSRQPGVPTPNMNLNRKRCHRLFEQPLRSLANKMSYTDKSLATDGKLLLAHFAFQSWHTSLFGARTVRKHSTLHLFHWRKNRLQPTFVNAAAR